MLLDTYQMAAFYKDTENKSHKLLESNAHSIPGASEGRGNEKDNIRAELGKKREEIGQ